MNNPNPTANTPAADDPRYGFAKVTEQLGQLMEATEAIEPSILTAETPCSEYAVSDLLDHVVMVMRRVVVIGSGRHWSEIEQDELGSGWTKAFRSAAHDAMEAWTDPAKLGQTFEVPWGEMPGAPLMLTYTGELAVHGWDLATATGQPFSVDDEFLGGALMAVKFIPAEGRDNPEVPFGTVVDPGPDAPLLLQLAGWAGRQVA
ncbi:MAG: TIGR03086 family metal-binding protein [Acidimicrobiales bacterium]